MIFSFLPLCGCPFFDLSIYYHAMRGMSRGKIKKMKKFSGEGCAGEIHIGTLGLRGQFARVDSLYLGEAKAGYRRANDKGQRWEAGASDKTR